MLNSEDQRQGLFFNGRVRPLRDAELLREVTDGMVHVVGTTLKEDSTGPVVASVDGEGKRFQKVRGS